MIKTPHERVIPRPQGGERKRLVVRLRLGIKEQEEVGWLVGRGFACGLGRT